MTDWIVYLHDGRTVKVRSRYYFISKYRDFHLFDNYDKNSWNEDSVARFSKDSVIGVVRG